MAGLDAYGAALERSNMAVPPVFTELANVTSISGPSFSRNVYDTTAHDSVDGWMEFIGGLRDAGELSFDLNWNPGNTTHASLFSDLNDTVPRAYKLVLAGDIAEFAFTALLTGFDVGLPVDEKLTAAVTFKLTGKPTLTVPAPA